MIGAGCVLAATRAATTASTTTGRFPPASNPSGNSGGWAITSLANLQDAVDASSDTTAEYLGSVNGTTAYGTFGFADPGGALVGTQKFRIKAAKSNPSATMQIIVKLVEGTTTVATLGTLTLTTTATVYEVTWDAAQITDRTKVIMRVEFADNVSGAYYSIWALEWLAQWSTTGGGGGGGGQPAGELPDPVRTVSVANASQLTSALSNARPGDHIVLADGTYSGSFTLAAAGTTADPIVVRAANKLRAVISGSFGMTGNYQRLWGLKFANGAYLSSLSGAGCKLLRCQFDGGPQVDNGATIPLRGPDCEIAYCEFLNHRTRAIDISVGGGGLRALIRRNWFHDVIETTSSTVYNIAIRVGTGDPDGSGSTVAACVIEYNLFERYPGHVAETVSLKTSGNTLRFNTLLNSKNSTFMCRHGSNNTVSGNWIENNTGDAGGIYVMQNDHVLLGNKAVSPCEIRIFAGNRTPFEDEDDYSPPAMYPAAWNTVVAGNEAPIRVGAYYNSANPPMTVNAKNTSIEAHTGTITYQRHENTTVSPTTTRPIPTPVKLTASQVGPDAP